MKPRTWSRLAVLWRRLWRMELSARSAAERAEDDTNYQRSIGRAERAARLLKLVEQLREGAV